MSMAAVLIIWSSLVLNLRKNKIKAVAVKTTAETRAVLIPIGRERIKERDVEILSIIGWVFSVS